MKRIFHYQISGQKEPLTILEFLKKKHYSAPVIAHLKRTPGGIKKNGAWTWVREQLKDGDCLTIQLIEESGSENIVPAPLPLSIVYEDEDLLVIDKPANMPIHPSQGNYSSTLANAVMFYFREKGETHTYRCINRLDRDTTGLLILAKHMYSASLLSDMVRQRKIHRTYLAIAEGRVPESGVIDAPISRAAGSVIERRVDFEHGEAARTYYEALSYKNGYSLVSLKLETGRTHQIRVHMKHIGHPLPGDFLYHPDYRVISRQALHSHRLELAHPVTGKPLSFTSFLPSDMLSVIR